MTDESKIVEQVRLGAEDRERLGLDDEWYTIGLRMRISEAMLLQEWSGTEDMDAFYAGLRRKRAQSLKAFFYLLLKRRGVGLSYEEFDFDMPAIERRNAPNPT